MLNMGFEPMSTVSRTGMLSTALIEQDHRERNGGVNCFIG